MLSPLSFQNTRVLVVDSDPQTGCALTQVLNQAGCDARLLPSCEAAVELASEFTPDVLIAEVVMPGMSGIELAYHFAEHYPLCRLLLISDVESVIEVLEDTSAKDGFVFLPKPLSTAAVLEFLAAGDSRSRTAA